ncbi:dihydroorotate dehydrogenase [Marasmius sp. AFHP31]|nr:dihydroorotate dehydrogenase [Marasmius sp. AFHP31]KAK1236086.1 dihydroorotate dehydrogenase [Marasmius sp. AFHP31]
MVNINSIVIEPTIVNSSCAWASDFAQLEPLYECTYTGAVTTRTATLDGFKENESHTVAFSSSSTTSLNSYGYSPHPLATYLQWIPRLLNGNHSTKQPQKPFIISITASKPDNLERMVNDIQELRKSIGDKDSKPSRIAIELNTSCPNIPGSPPSAYESLSDNDTSLRSLLKVLKTAHQSDHTLTIGLKLPPFVYRQQFTDFITLLKQIGSGSDAESFPISFMTCTNTLGNSLMFSEEADEGGKFKFAVPTATGGLAGEALHSLALGNVFTFTELLAKDTELKDIAIIGVGGVTNGQAASRMRQAGAKVVGCATLLGLEGVEAFETVSRT